jgi:drug/metabolite transporter (DMT)-like permease
LGSWKSPNITLKYGVDNYGNRVGQSGHQNCQNPAVAVVDCRCVLRDLLCLGHNLPGDSWAERRVSSGLAALLVATEPLWILLMGAAMQRQRINWQNGLGLLLGLAGVAVLTFREFTTVSSMTWGVVAVLVGAASWAIGVCVSPLLKLPHDAMGRAAIPLVCGAGLLLLTAGVSGEFAAVHWSAVSLWSLLGLVYLILFGSVVAFTAYTWLLQHCSPTLVATHTFVNPLVAVLAGWLLASEPMGLRIILATVVILSAILLIQRGDRQSEEEVSRTTVSSR